MSAAAAASKSSNYDVENFLKALECPVNLDLLTDAVSLSPCMHKVNAAAAKAIYGQMISNEAGVKERKPCIICKQTVTAYYEDHFTRGIVALLMGSKQLELIPQVSAKIQADFKEMNAGDIPFPGKPAKFECVSGKWESYNSGADLERCMEFQCITTIENSLFKSFSILGYKDGSVSIFIRFNYVTEKLTKYFHALGIQTDDLFLGSLKCNGMQAKKLFSVLARHNEIPNTHFDLIRTLIEHGDWKKVDQMKQVDVKANQK